MAIDFTRLWFWEFSGDVYDIVLAVDADAATREILNHHGDESGTARLMSREEVAPLRGSIPLMTFDTDYDWSCAKWLEEIEADRRRRAYEAELAAKQVELFT